MVTRPAAGGLLAPENRAVAMALMAAVAMASYNNLSATAALPDIGDDLGRVALLPWVVTVELLAAAIAVLAVGPFIDGAGARRAFRLTVVGFIVSSGLCTAAPTMELLVAARVLQGLATGALIGTAITSVGLVFDEALRPWVYALVSSVWGLMGIGGPALAAVLVSTLGWRAVFAVNLPVAAAAAAVGWRRLPAEPQAAAEALDRRGLLVMSGVAVALLLAASSVHWSSLVLLAVAGLLLAVYVRHSRGCPSPVVRLAHITGRRWWPVHTVSVMAVAGGTGASVYLPLYLRGARGSSVPFAAFAVLWPTLGWSTAAWVSGKLQKHLRVQTVVLIGSGIITAAGAAVTLAAGLEAPFALLFAAFFGVGWGTGTITTSGLSLLQGRADAHEMGRVSSAHQFIRSLGFAYGAALAGLVLFGVVNHRTGDVEAVRDLLGDAGSALDGSVAAVLASAYTWSLATTAVISALTVPAALVLALGYNPDRSYQD